MTQDELRQAMFRWAELMEQDEADDSDDALRQRQDYNRKTEE